MHSKGVRSNWPLRTLIVRGATTSGFGWLVQRLQLAYLIAGNREKDMIQGCDWCWILRHGTK